MLVSSLDTDIGYTMNKNKKIQSLIINFNPKNNTEKNALYMTVLWACKKYKDTIYCPHFGDNVFYLSYTNGPQYPVKLFQVCSIVMNNHDKYLSRYFENVPEKIKLLYKKFGGSIAQMIIEYIW